MVNVLKTKTKEITPDGQPGDTDIPTNQSKLAEIHVAEAKHGKTLGVNQDNFSTLFINCAHVTVMLK